MASLCWRTLKIIRFAERHSVFLQNMLTDTAPIKIFISDFGGERRAAKYHFCPCLLLLLPSPFSSLPCSLREHEPHVAADSSRSIQRHHGVWRYAVAAPGGDRAIRGPARAYPPLSAPPRSSLDPLSALAESGHH